MSDAPHWSKSSYSSMANACVEIALVNSGAWSKSSHSSMGNDCVEVALMDAVPRFASSSGSMGGGNRVEVAFVDPMAVLMRDTRYRDSTVIAAGSREWSGWLRSVVRDR
ncbi:hypothetical protein SUDANB121_04296 [Nocardiopsis dassonvillei]|uniref:DUF397 domain-containing protein n=1 Tax=Nocardiopsis dassonvillei TaxID=2014 RepID=UPI003F555760